MKSFKNALCITLVIGILLSIIPTASFAVDYLPENGAFVFSNEDMLNYLHSPNNLAVSFDSDEKALKLTANGGIDPRVLLDLSTVTPALSANKYKSILLIYKVPTTASTSVHSAEFFLSAGSIEGPTAGYSHLFTLTKSDKFVSTIIDLSATSWWSGNIHSIRIDPFTSAQNGDTMYIDSIILCQNQTEAISVRDERMAELNKVVIPNYSDSDYICTSYRYDKYTSPLWKGNIIYNEAVYPVKDANGNAVYTLMYTPDEITSVYSSDFSSYYYEGIDYTVDGNRITFLDSGSIRLKEYTYIHPQSNPNGYNWDRYYNRKAAGDGKWEYWGQSPEFFNGYINVSYTHSDAWNDYVPEQRSNEIPNAASVIENGGSMNVVFYGDSICGGANSSSNRDVYPYAEYWNEMIVSKLTKDYGCSINATYASVGGSTASGMVQYINSKVTSKAPDLVFLEFGANDAMNASQDDDYSASRLKSEYKNAIKSMIEEVRAYYPNCEFVLVAPFYCNIYCHYMSYFEACRDALDELAASYSGITVADITAMHKSLLEYKDYLDFSGDNMCHPNDFMARIYAQVCLEAIVPGGISPYVVSEEPPQAEPDVGNTTNAAPQGYGWQWTTAEAYGFLGNYGTNGQDIEFCVDLALISSSAEEACAIFYTKEGGDIKITPSSISVGGRTKSHDWGIADISNWHTVKLVFQSGTAYVYIDGELIAQRNAGFVVNTDYQLFFSYTGCMAIDNVSLSSLSGKVYFDCNFENAAIAEKLMGGGLGERTLLKANTVFFDANGGVGDIPNQIKVTGNDLIITEDIPTKEGYSFLGWSSDIAAEAPEYVSGGIYSENASVMLYAVWEKDTTEEPEIMPGDLTGDGMLSAADLNILLRFIAGSVMFVPDTAEYCAADLNGDGYHTAKDVSALLRSLAG